jgi:hypothetical protein
MERRTHNWRFGWRLAFAPTLAANSTSFRNRCSPAVGNIAAHPSPKRAKRNLQILDGVLSGLDELTIIGYGFADEHINFRLSNAMLLNPKLRIMIVDPYRTDIPPCLRQFDYDGRVRHASCSAAQWMEHRDTGVWNQAQMKTLKDNEHYRAEIRMIVEAHLNLG